MAATATGPTSIPGHRIESHEEHVTSAEARAHGQAVVNERGPQDDARGNLTAQALDAHAVAQGAGREVGLRARVAARRADPHPGDRLSAARVHVSFRFDIGVAAPGRHKPQPRPTNGIFVAMIVMNCMLASSGRLAMCSTASATCCDVHHRLDGDLAVGLRHALRHPRRHVGQRVADVDLAARDVVLAAVERRRLGQPGDRVLGRGVGRRVRARRVRRDRTVVDDAPAARRLRSSSSGTPACVQRNTPVRLMSTTAFHCSNVRSSSGTAGAPTPALLNSTSRRPNVSARRANSASHRRGIAHVGGHGGRGVAAACRRPRAPLHPTLPRADRRPRRDTPHLPAPARLPCRCR